MPDIIIYRNNENDRYTNIVLGMKYMAFLTKVEHKWETNHYPHGKIIAHGRTPEKALKNAHLELDKQRKMVKQEQYTEMLREPLEDPS